MGAGSMVFVLHTDISCEGPCEFFSLKAKQEINPVQDMKRIQKLMLGLAAGGLLSPVFGANVADARASTSLVKNHLRSATCGGGFTYRNRLNSTKYSSTDRWSNTATNLQRLPHTSSTAVNHWHSFNSASSRSGSLSSSAGEPGHSFKGALNAGRWQVSAASQSSDNNHRWTSARSPSGDGPFGSSPFSRGMAHRGPQRSSITSGSTPSPAGASNGQSSGSSAARSSSSGSGFNLLDQVLGDAGGLFSGGGALSTLEDVGEGLLSLF